MLTFLLSYLTNKSIVQTHVIRITPIRSNAHVNFFKKKVICPCINSLSTCVSKLRDQIFMPIKANEAVRPPNKYLIFLA